MNKGNSTDECIPKFFKVYLPDESGDDLELPISFNRYLPKSLPRTVTVRSTYGNIWTMVFRKCCGHDVEKFVMINGWKRIVKEEDLKGGEFLVFEFDGFRLFNFCIYGHATCKKLRSSVQTKEIQDRSESDGENGKSCDDIRVLDDHDGDNFDVHGAEDKFSANIILLDDDDDDDDDDDINDVQDDNEEDTSSHEDITILDDDNDVVEEATSREDIIIIDDDSDDDENETRTGVKTEGKEKDSSGVLKKSGNEDDRKYLDNVMNPFFRVNLNLRSRDVDLLVPSKVIIEYGLHFRDSINLIDPLEKEFGKLIRKFMNQRIIGFDSIIRRNIVKSTDNVICELKKDTSGLVRVIKVHVIRG